MQPDLCRTCSETTLLVFPRGGSFDPVSSVTRGFLDNGKHSLQTRGLIVLLMSKAAGPGSQECDPHEMVSGIYPRFVHFIFASLSMIMLCKTFENFEHRPSGFVFQSDTKDEQRLDIYNV